MNTFGARLRSVRDLRGLTQEEVGFRLDVTKATISKWETSRSEPTLAQLALLSELYGVSTDSLVKNVGDWRVHETPGTYDVRSAASRDELSLLMRFRELSPDRQRGLIELLKPDR